MSSKIPKKVTKQDLESKLRDIQGDVHKAVESARPAISAIAVAVGVAIISIAFVVGIGVGKKRNTVVEIKRM